MVFEQHESNQTIPHHIHLDERRTLSIAGVLEVESFDEESIVMSTSQGELIIRGSGLHIEQLSLDGGDLKVEGAVDSLTYEEQPVRGGFFARLLR